MGLNFYLAQREEKSFMSNTMRIKRITGTAVLAALAVVLQLFGNIVIPGFASINLALIPIALGAILYGPLAGLFLGLVNGAVVLFGAQAFLAVSPFWTVVICLAKTGTAGFVSGLLFKLFKGKWMILGMYISSIVIPIINSSIFALGCLTVLRPWLDGVSESLNNSNIAYVLFIVVIGINFLFELAVEIVLTPVIIYVFKVVTKKFDLGDNVGDVFYKKESVPTIDEDEQA